MREGSACIEQVKATKRIEYRHELYSGRKRARRKGGEFVGAICQQPEGVVIRGVVDQTLSAGHRVDQPTERRCGPRVEDIVLHQSIHFFYNKCRCHCMQWVACLLRQICMQ